jgi:hypothetical protein
MMEKEKVVLGIITIPMAGAVVLATAILIAEGAEDVEEAAMDAVVEETIVSIYKMSNVSIVARKVTISLTAPYREIITMKIQTWFPRRISKNLFQSSLKEMLTKKDKQGKKNAEGDDESLDMNMFVTKSNDDLLSINDTDTFDYSMQDKITHKFCEHYNF